MGERVEMKILLYFFAICFVAGFITEAMFDFIRYIKRKL